MKRKGKTTVSKIQKETLCMIALVIIIIVSMGGYYMTKGGPVEEEEQTGEIAARIIVNFGDNEQVVRIVNLTQGAKAQAVFESEIDLITEATQTGIMVTGVSTENRTQSENITHRWMFYVNGGFSIADVDEYQVRHGDSIELRFEEKA